MLIGDGITDDRAAMQTVIDGCPVGGTAILEPEKVYRIVIDYSVPDRGLIAKENTKLDLNGSRINFECHGDVYGMRFKNRFKIVNGTVATTVSDGLGSAQGIYHAPLALGTAYGETLDLNNRGPFIEAEGWGIHNLEVSTVKPGGLHISGLGGVRDGHISDIRAPNNSNAVGLINFDWGTIGPTGTIPQNRANFLNNTFCTVHPTNIKVERIKAGAFTHPSSEVIRLSGCGGIDISNVYVKDTGYTGFSHYGGDFGYEFCKYGAVRYAAFQNTAVRGLTIEHTGTHAIRLDTYADNIAREAGYSPLTPPIYPTNLLIDGLTANGSNTGLNLGYMAGGTLTRARLNWFHIGANYNANLSRFLWTDSVVHGGDSTAIQTQGNAAGVTTSRVIFEY